MLKNNLYVDLRRAIHETNIRREITLDRKICYNCYTKTQIGKLLHFNNTW